MLKLLRRNLLMLCRNKSPAAINNESVIVAPRANSQNALMCVQTNLTQWLSCRLLNLDVPHNDLTVETLEVGVGCGQDTLKKTNKPTWL